MLLAEFKDAFEIEKIDLMTCKESDRLRASEKINGKTMLTTVEFDPQAPIYVYEAEADDEHKTPLYILSNKEPFVGELVASI